MKKNNSQNFNSNVISPSPLPPPSRGGGIGAELIEIFSSFQGEGTHLGERQTFIRFQHCDLKCRWCDTPESFKPHENYRVEKIPFSQQWESFSNPVSGKDLENWLVFFSNPVVSLTGGEPLQQVDFLEAWLPQVSRKYHFLLETNGILADSLKRISPWIDIVSMDIKLPSSAKTGSFWKEHEAFLNQAKNCKECYVKIVLTEDTLESELAQAFDLIYSAGKEIPVILQPVSQTRSFKKELSPESLEKFSKLASLKLKNCRVIPQLHKFLGIA